MWLVTKYNFIMQKIDLTALLTELLPIVQAAGDAIMAVYRAGEIDFQQKVDQSPVTRADLAAHDVLVQRLKLLIAGCPIVSEEDETSHPYRDGKNRFWLIDPLDGTREFISHNGEFTVNVALIEEGRSVLGAVYAPAMDCMYWGGPGLGAFRRTESDTWTICVSSGEPEDICRVVASRSHLDAGTQTFIDRLGEVLLLQVGSSLKFCRVAEGMADIYPRLAPTSEWDTAAAQAILEGAGGKVIDLDGRALRYGKPGVLNPAFIAVRDVALIPV
ncbi:3'(2'),5'-bisphosphate nucleotidase [Nitrosomonas sp. HPC101]|nr:3'(2'),5'-bisphosphate nucleotidase [Nitrosomonas sp. HPC101]